ncbi:lipopolysaccharide assembly LapA domain-containing protein [Marinilactibacillus sp. Marseille-P9653]|uniref:LapA family protein n=1 Tax=Marinilactibacillus sp. Marseille-P9653 TaxID=2866583 RepID=UPI001CE4491E|nr:lipopolysaccharide assembly protein LapA domain-containing protein [Marinilactibacillus sp. Marseille-P9653]
MKKQWSFVGAFILFLLVAILSVLNVDPVPINFGFATYEWPLIIVILGALLLGALIATLLSTVKIYQESKTRKEAEKSSTQAKEHENARVNELEDRYNKEIDQLKQEIRVKEKALQTEKSKSTMNTTPTSVEDETL